MHPQVIQFCNAEGQEVRLRVILKELESCQKALNEYLDMKKSIFPRFYFMSNVALLDILRYAYELHMIVRSLRFNKTAETLRMAVRLSICRIATGTTHRRSSRISGTSLKGSTAWTWSTARLRWRFKPAPRATTSWSKLVISDARKRLRQWSPKMASACASTNSS